MHEDITRPKSAIKHITDSAAYLKMYRYSAGNFDVTNRNKQFLLDVYMAVTTIESEHAIVFNVFILHMIPVKQRNTTIPALQSGICGPKRLYGKHDDSYGSQVPKCYLAFRYLRTYLASDLSTWRLGPVKTNEIICEWFQRKQRNQIGPNGMWLKVPLFPPSFFPNKY